MDRLSLLLATFLLNALWQVALLATATALADRRLRGAPARHRHALWTICLAAAIILPMASTRSFTPEAVAPQAAAPATLPASRPSSGARTGLAVVNSGRGSSRASLAAVHRGVQVPGSLARGALAAYLLFLVFMTIRLTRAWLRTRQICRFASAGPAADSVPGKLERCLSLMAGRRPRAKTPNPALRWSSHLAGPVTVGAFRPAIILPLRLSQPGAREDLNGALAHEAAHVLRRDYLRNLLNELLSLPVAFHPLIWLIKRRLVESRELACDELAAKVLDPALYARSLVRMAYHISRFTSPVAPRLDYTLGVFDADILEERVMRLVKPRASMRLAKFSLFSAALLLASSCLGAALFSVVPAPQPFILRKAESAVSGGVSGSAHAGSIARAQSESEAKTGSLSGIVVDSSGARVPKAEVRLISRNNSFTKTTESSETGDFSFDEIPAGRYTLEVSSSGMGGSFRSFDFKAEGQPPFFPFVLHPGNVTESAVVTAKAPAASSKAVPMGPHRIRVGGNVEAAKLIESPPPVYPESARSQGLQGVVLLEATISPQGVPTDFRVLGSPGEDLTKAALDAVSQWRYQPTLLNGDPVEVVTTITVNFQLQN